MSQQSNYTVRNFYRTCLKTNYAPSKKEIKDLVSINNRYEYLLIYFFPTIFIGESCLHTYFYES